MANADRAPQLRSDLVFHRVRFMVDTRAAAFPSIYATRRTQRNATHAGPIDIRTTRVRLDK